MPGFCIQTHPGKCQKVIWASFKIFSYAHVYELHSISLLIYLMFSSSCLNNNAIPCPSLLFPHAKKKYVLVAKKI